MASPSQNFLDQNSNDIHTPAVHDPEQRQLRLQGAEHSSPMLCGADTEKQQSKRSKGSSKSANRVKLATITLEEYMNVFDRLTGGNGNVVQPNLDIKSFTHEQLKSVLRLHALKTSGKNKDNMLHSLVGLELWHPTILPPGLIEPGNITDEEMLEALTVLQW